MAGDAPGGGGIAVTIALDDKALDAALDRAIRASADLTAPMTEVAAEWVMLVHDRFEAEIDPLGVPWAKRRVTDGEDDDGHKILQQMGYLRNAVKPDAGRDFAQVGVDRSAAPAAYARIHNEGGTIRPKTARALAFGGRFVSQVVMPRRQYIGFGPKEQDSVQAVMGAFLRGLFAAPGSTGGGAGA